VNDWTVSSLRGNLVVNLVTGFGNFDNVNVAFDSVKFDYELRELYCVLQTTPYIIDIFPDCIKKNDAIKK